jgi:hypothetical protein
MVKAVDDRLRPERGGWLTTGNPSKMTARSGQSYTHPPALEAPAEKILS